MMDQVVCHGRSGERSGLFRCGERGESSEQVHDLSPFPAGTTHVLSGLERGGDAAMSFHLGVGCSVAQVSLSQAHVAPGF